MFDVNFNIKLSDKSKAWICDKFHKEFHEHYDEEVGDCGYGPIWDTGIRCKKCGRKWPDPVEVKRQKREWLNEQARFYHIYFGTTDEQIFTLSGEWNDLERFHEEYNSIREMFLHPDEFHEDEPRDIGSIEDKWFIFNDDLGGCDVVIDGGGFNKEFNRELDLLNNWPGLLQPMHPEAKKAWDRVRVPYREAIERVKNHKVVQL